MSKKPLREYLDDGKFYYVPEIFDCMSTKTAEISGFEMVMISSSDFSCAYTGIPDLLLLTIDEYCAAVERITNMTDMPLFIDADDGFGRPLQTYYACKRMAKAGADSILITDRRELGRPGLLSIKDAEYRFRAAKEGMEGNNCLLMARCDHSVDEGYDEFAERCQRYLDAGADIICPLHVNESKKFGSKLDAAKKIATDVKGLYWYPDLDYGDRVDGKELLKYGYKFTGVHYAFRAAMYAMLDVGRHVYEDLNNDYIAHAYDYTGFKFHYSPACCFFKDGKWVELEKHFVDDPEESFALYRHRDYCYDDDFFGPNDPKHAKKE